MFTYTIKKPQTNNFGGGDLLKSLCFTAKDWLTILTLVGKFFFPNSWHKCILLKIKIITPPPTLTRYREY